MVSSCLPNSSSFSVVFLCSMSLLAPSCLVLVSNQLVDLEMPSSFLAYCYASLYFWLILIPFSMAFMGSYKLSNHKQRQITLEQSRKRQLTYYLLQVLQQHLLQIQLMAYLGTCCLHRLRFTMHHLNVCSHLIPREFSEFLICEGSQHFQSLQLATQGLFYLLLQPQFLFEVISLAFMVLLCQYLFILLICFNQMKLALQLGFQLKTCFQTGHNDFLLQFGPDSFLKRFGVGQVTFTLQISAILAYIISLKRRQILVVYCVHLIATLLNLLYLLQASRNLFYVKQGHLVFLCLYYLQLVLIIVLILGHTYSDLQLNIDQYSKMKRVEIKQEQRPRGMMREDSENSSQLADEPQELSFVPKAKRKEVITLTYRGIIESGNIHSNQSLSLLYTAVSSQNWKLSHGQQSGFSQNASHNGGKIIWNFPFEMTFQAAKPEGWPQLVVIIYGKDYLGRSIAKGYGNFHLPVSAGTQYRKIRIFQTIAPTTTASLCAMIMGYINQLKQPQKVLTEGGRQYLQTKSIGEVTVKIETRRYNFQNQGYD